MGFFYLIQPLPGDAPWHLKLGYSENVERRLRSYQILCPDAEIIKVWPCPGRDVEADAMNHCEREGFERIGPEVFCVLYPERMVACLDHFFDALAEDALARRSAFVSTPLPKHDRLARDGYITRTVLARRMGIPLARVDKLIASGQLPAYAPLGNISPASRKFLKLSDVEANLELLT